MAVLFDQEIRLNLVNAVQSIVNPMGDHYEEYAHQFVDRLSQFYIPLPEYEFQTFCQSVLDSDCFPYSISRSLLIFITIKLPDQHVLWKLKCIRNLFIPYIKTLPVKVCVQMWHAIVTFCIKVRYGQGLWILETESIISDILTSCDSLAAIWKSASSNFPLVMDRRCLSACDSIMEDCLYTPSRYMEYSIMFIEEIPSTTLERSLPLQVRLGLYKTLHHTQLMSSVFFEHAFPFSDRWIKVLKELRPLSLEFDCEITYLVNDLQKNKFNISVGSLFDEEILIIEQEVQSDQLDMLLRECCLSLSSSNSRFISLTTYCLIQIMKSVLRNKDQDMQTTAMNLCETTWHRLFLSLLDESISNPIPHLLYHAIVCFFYYKKNVGLTDDHFIESLAVIRDKCVSEMCTYSITPNSRTTLEKLFLIATSS
ncbi:hypothetical protein BDB01DRAFT_846872 [Pilobolus umbonatus]|nr:hypothetical protein BDB01DRAFT_846872 [Pilobolus umbonatus]